MNFGGITTNSSYSLSKVPARDFKLAKQLQNLLSVKPLPQTVCDVPICMCVVDRNKKCQNNMNLLEL